MASMVHARFHMAAKKSGLRAHVGTELSVNDESGTTLLSAAMRIAHWIPEPLPSHYTNQIARTEAQ